MGKYGTNFEGLGAYEGGVNADKGAPLVSTSSDGSTALLFGPAALREQLAGVANGDFAIPPDAAGDTITEENPLPYWTFTDVNSAGAITCAVVADSGSGSGNILRWSIANGTTTGKSARISRYIPIPASRDRAISVFPTAYISEALGTNAQFKITYGFFTQDLTPTGSAASATRTTVGSLSPSLSVINNAPADAAFVLLYITAETTGTTAALTGDLAEVRLGNYFSTLLVPESSDPATYVAGLISQSSGNLRLSGNNGSGAVLLTGNADVGGDFTVTGSVGILGYSNLTGSTLSQYNNISAADNTTITTAGTFLALTNLEVSFTPQFVGQRWLFTFTGYASLNTAVAQYAFVRADVTTSANVAITSPWAYSRSENPGVSGRGGAVAISKVWVADRTTGCKFKLYGTTQTTNGLILSVSYSALTAYPIG
jgi:hypothetical protein